jgi:hypothetical protein
LESARHGYNNLALDADLEEHHAKQEELIETLVLKYGRTDEYIRKLVCNGAKYGNKRGVNMKNAILHEYCNKAREGECLSKCYFAGIDTFCFRGQS